MCKLDKERIAFIPTCCVVLQSHVPWVLSILRSRACFLPLIPYLSVTVRTGCQNHDKQVQMWGLWKDGLLNYDKYFIQRFRYPLLQQRWMDYIKKLVLIYTNMKRQIPQKRKLSFETDLISFCSQSACWSSLSFWFWLEHDLYLSQLFLILFHRRRQNNNKHITLLPVYIKNISGHRVFQSHSWYWHSSWVALRKVVLTFPYLELLTLWDFLLNLHAILPWRWNKMEETHFKNWLCSRLNCKSVSSEQAEKS